MKQTKNSKLPFYKEVNLDGKELWREYRFPGNEIVRIELPKILIVSDNGHRIMAGSISYYIPYGWISLQWQNPDDRPEGFFCRQSKVERIKMLESKNK